MAILFSSSDDCRWPKIQFKKPEKMFFVSREFSRFVNFAFLRHFFIVLIIFVAFLMIFLSIYIIILFLTLFWLSIFSSKINRFSAKNWIITKASKNKNIDQNNENIWFSCFSSLFRKNKLQKCFKKPFLGPICATPTISQASVASVTTCTWLESCSIVWLNKNMKIYWKKHENIIKSLIIWFSTTPIFTNIMKTLILPSSKTWFL